MSVRSDVRITCLKSDYDALVNAYREEIKSIMEDDSDIQRRSWQKEIPGNALFDDIPPTTLRTVKSDTDEEPTIVFGWDDIRWYDDIDPVILAFNAAMSEVFIDADTHPISFVRIEPSSDTVDAYIDDESGRLSCHVSPEMQIVEW